MPRTLPWMANTAAKNREANSSPSVTLKRKSEANSDTDLVDADLNPLRPERPNDEVERNKQRRRLRTPSTSPPPAPPTVELMRPGYSADDIYLMVEDEFLSTAKAFTQHIHHAEYVRLKKLARSRGARTLRSIERGVDGRTAQSAEVKLKLEAAEGVKRRRDGLRILRYGDASSEDEDDEVDPYMMDEQLAGLMTREQVGRSDLSAMLKARSHTRAAAGFSQSPGNVERKKDALRDEQPLPSSRKLFKGEVDSDENERAQEQDLSHRTAAVLRTSHSTKVVRPVAGISGGRGDHIKKTAVSAIFKRFARTGPSHEQVALNDDSDDSTDDDLDRVQVKKPSNNSNRHETASASSHKHEATRRLELKGRPSVVSFDSSPSDDWRGKRQESGNTSTNYIAKRRAARDEQARKEKRKAARTDDIPTFIF